MKPSRTLVSIALLLFVSLLPGRAQATPIVQTGGPASTYICCQSWIFPTLSTVTLAQGTNVILGLTSSAVTYDQGWGGSDPGNNGVNIYLDVNGSNIWGAHVAGAGHYTYGVQNFDIANFAGMLTSLNAALNTIDWSTTPSVIFESVAILYSYPGWTLTVSNATFTVTSDTVPAPGALLLLGLGLLGLGVLRRRSAR